MERWLTDWPGKSAREGGDEHPAVYHMLDVAAVAEVLLAPLDLPPERKAAFTLLVALHDLGKIGSSFRAMLREGKAQPFRHWEMTEAWLLPQLRPLAERLSVHHATLKPLIGAIAGHHGWPAKGADQNYIDHLNRNPDPEAQEDALAVLDAFCALWPDASLAGMREGEAKAISWWMAGLTTAADWVGSNVDWFPARAAGPAPAVYLVRARSLAATAVGEAGLGGCPVRDGWLLDFASEALRPMQREVQAIPLRDGPMLAFVEDETGAGKTEAMLLLAQRMLLAGKGRGLFLALPTMATADAMFTRGAAVLGRLFDRPSLTLAHGRARLSVPFRDLVGREAVSNDVTCAPWLADNRRRALLADVGIGTIDQALLSVLPTKFATLRLWGLAGKILIVDEAHEMGQPYMAEQLAQLLRVHAGQGGSAIMMSATLPLDLRAKLGRAFGEGAGRAWADNPSDQYPALSVAGGAAVRVMAAPSARAPWRRGGCRLPTRRSRSSRRRRRGGRRASGSGTRWTTRSPRSRPCASEGFRPRCCTPASRWRTASGSRRRSLRSSAGTGMIEAGFSFQLR